MLSDPVDVVTATIEAHRNVVQAGQPLHMGCLGLGCTWRMPLGDAPKAAMQAHQEHQAQAVVAALRDARLMPRPEPSPKAAAPVNIQQIIHDIEEARALRHPQRAMQVLLACGHLRLMPWTATVAGADSYTACASCSGGEQVVRLVVEVSETGALWHDSMDQEHQP